MGSIWVYKLINAIFKRASVKNIDRTKEEMIRIANKLCKNIHIHGQRVKAALRAKVIGGIGRDDEFLKNFISNYWPENDSLIVITDHYFAVLRGEHEIDVYQNKEIIQVRPDFFNGSRILVKFSHGRKLLIKMGDEFSALNPAKVLKKLVLPI